ncbi:MAG: MFS transporter [Armatimonadetes bacterium]|nr:MFS transporter [Armatimonadota bacterium]
MTFRDVLRIPAYRNLWLGQAISIIGDALYYTSFMFMVKKVTGNDSMVGVVGALEAIPFILFSGFAGVLADRVDRKKILIWSDLLCALGLIVAVLVSFGVAKPPLWVLLVMPFLLSSVRCFFRPALNAVLPNLVPKEAIPTATTLTQTTNNLAPLFGLAISASAIASIWEFQPKLFFVLVFGVNAVSFLASAGFLLLVPPVIPDREDLHEAHPWQDFKDGLRFIKGRRELVVLIALIFWFRLFVAPFFVVYIASNDLWFGGKPSTLAWFEFSFFAAMLVATPLVAKLNIRRPTWSFAIGLAMVGLFVGFMAFSRSIWLFVLWNALCGIAIPITDLPINIWLQHTIPDEFRGRFYAAMNMLGAAAVPIGSALGGLLVKSLGLESTFILMGVGMIASGLIGFLDAPYRNVRAIQAESEPKASTEGVAERMSAP